MKRVGYLLLILILCAGCSDNKKKVTILPGPGPDSWSTPDDTYESNKVLKLKIKGLESVISKLEDEIKQNEFSLTRIADLEAVIEAKKSEIKIAENEYRLYELVIDAQKITIETLEKLCLLYEKGECEKN